MAEAGDAQRLCCNPCSWLSTEMGSSLWDWYGFCLGTTTGMQTKIPLSAGVQGGGGDRSAHGGGGGEYPGKRSSSVPGTAENVSDSSLES